MIVTKLTDLLRVADLSRHDLLELLDLATSMKADPLGWVDSHRGESVALIFEKPSTRTRVSFAAAAQRLGMLPISLSPSELQLGRGETIADTARALAEFTSAIAVRTYSQQTLIDLASASKVPVVNALSDDHHPCQALGDLMTVRERVGHLTGLRLAFVGDGRNNVVHSLMEGGALTGMDIAIACPPAYRPDPPIEAQAQTTASRNGGRIEVMEDPTQAVNGARAVYTDVWVSMGEEKEQAERVARLRPYQVTAELMARARPDAFFMHCLPAHRGNEVAAEVIDGEHSVVWQQAGNRLPTEQAVLHTLIGARR